MGTGERSWKEGAWEEYALYCQRNCHAGRRSGSVRPLQTANSAPAVGADAIIEFLCWFNVEDREADFQDRYVLYKLPRALRPLVPVPSLSSYAGSMLKTARHLPQKPLATFFQIRSVLHMLFP